MAYNFNSYASVRALLGVSNKELPDTVLSDPIYASKLGIDLVDIDSAIEDKYATAKAETTPAAISFVRAFDVYAAHAVGYFCLPALPLFSPKSVTDGKASFSRDSSSPYRFTAEELSLEYQKYRKALADMLAVYDGGTATKSVQMPLAVVSSPTYNPITGS